MSHSAEGLAGRAKNVEVLLDASAYCEFVMRIVLPLLLQRVEVHGNNSSGMQLVLEEAAEAIGQRPERLNIRCVDPELGQLQGSAQCMSVLDVAVLKIEPIGLDGSNQIVVQSAWQIAQQVPGVENHAGRV